MFDSMKTAFGRRDLFRRGGMLAAAQALLGGSRPAYAAAPATAGKLRLGPDIYQSIGVRPLINCRGTLTVISGSLELPEVRAAVDAGGQHHVVLDELMEGVGAPPGRVDRRGVGAGVLGLRGRNGAHHRGLRHRRQSRPARAHSRT